MIENITIAATFHSKRLIAKNLDTFFFVGTGNITHVIQQTKARTIGYELGDPLDSYKGDDVMVRLPKGIRTFDVDFLTIYNEDEKKYYAHAELPSLLVPPCVDDL
ncbi:unnamed protein product [Strongylus vulgaris]|uniref:DM13 domain-containing protein n=1 Tax=Strongylus vulgaris TaxID=40348 RepID=A0A3P7JI54_STRVU|nr:unnamed protein product [Strongylus vulgaris]